MGERSNQVNWEEQSDTSLHDQDVVIVRETEVAYIPEDAETTAATDEIRAEIEQTRSNLSETIEAIQAKLNPTTLKDQVIEQVKEQVQEAKESVKEQVREQVQEAKDTVREATIGRVEHMVHDAGDTINDAGSSLFDTVRQNPIPAALAGIGLGWLFMNRRSSQARRPSGYSNRPGRYNYRSGERYYADERYDERQRPYAGGSASYQGRHDYGDGNVLERGQRAVGDTVHQAQDTLGNLTSRAQETAGSVVGRAQETAGTVVDKAQETASQLSDRAQETAGTVVDKAQETASQLSDRAQYQAQRFEDRFQSTLRTNPMAVGAVALALGTAVGLLVPETQKEHELMGEARDQLVDKAQAVASETMDKVQRVAGQVTEVATNTAKDEAQKQGLTVHQ